MKIGVMSDSHDHLSNLQNAIKMMIKKGVDAAIHCGDFCAPFMMTTLENLEVQVYAVFGNVDGDKFRMMEKKPKNLNIYGELCDIELGGRKIAVVHYPEFADALARSSKYDAVFYGHTHIRRVDMVGSTLLANPGELMDLKGKPAFAIYNTDSNDFNIFEL